MESLESIICETVPYCIFCVDPAGRLLYANHKFFDFVKDNFETTVRIGEYVLELLSKSRRALWDSRLKEAFSGQYLRVEEVLESEYGDRYFDVIYHPVPLEGRCEKVLVYFEETTVRRRRELRLLEVELELQETVATRETLLSVISHDLRSPIFQLNGLLYNIRLSNDARDEARIQLLAEDLEERIAHLTHTLDNLLSWSNLNRQNLNPKPLAFSLNAVVEHAVGLLKPHATHKGVKVLYKVPAGLQLVSDREMVAFIIRNIANNAIKFSREGGTVSIESEQADGITRMVFSDHGVGMDEAQLDELRRQHRLQSDAGTWGERGTGLGLPLCYEFLQRLHGTIEFESVKDHGTRITVCLPDLAAPQG